MVFGEFLGENSIAGHHEAEPHKIVLFDVMTDHKQRKFVHPKTFVKDFAGLVPTPDVVYEGNMNEQLIADVRANKYNLKEGVICKGIEKSGAFAGGIWMCKIKTQEYLDKLKTRFGDEWVKYAE